MTQSTGKLPYKPRRRVPAEVRFWRKVEKTETCWIWTAGKIQGYGDFSAGGQQVYAHRWSYEHHIGPIPAGLQIDHLCRNPACVRPDHLEPVTGKENVRRGLAGPRVACKNGHEYTEANTYRRPDNGKRQCKECVRLRSRLPEAQEWRREYQRAYRLIHGWKGHPPAMLPWA